jgi:hypothetical protein
VKRLGLVLLVILIIWVLASPESAATVVAAIGELIARFVVALLDALANRVEGG